MRPIVNHNWNIRRLGLVMFTKNIYIAFINDTYFRACEFS